MPSVPAQNKVRVTVSVDDVDLGSFIGHEGGGVAGESVKIRPGAGEIEVILAAPKTYENVVVNKLYDDRMRARRLWLDERINKGAMVVSFQPLDADDNPFGKTDGVRGQLIRFTPPNSDANSTGDGSASICELEMSTEKWF